MASISALFQPPHYGSALSDVAAMSQRPTFELQFSLLQDQIVNRLNKEITATNQDSGKVDVFLSLEKARLERMTVGIDDFRVDVSRNHNIMADIVDDIDSLLASVDAAAAGDATEFNRLLGSIQTRTDTLKNPDGVTVGIMFEDGVRGLKNGGVMRNAADAPVTSYADYADATEARTAITAALTRLTAVQVQTDSKIDLINDIDQRIGSDLLSVRIDIEAAQQEDYAAKADTISKLKERYSNMLKSLSLGFEASYSMTEYFTKHLLAPTDVDKGSVMNLFT